MLKTATPARAVGSDYEMFFDEHRSQEGSLDVVFESPLEPARGKAAVYLLLYATMSKGKKKAERERERRRKQEDRTREAVQMEAGGPRRRMLDNAVVAAGEILALHVVQGPSFQHEPINEATVRINLWQCRQCGYRNWTVRREWKAGFRKRIGDEVLVAEWWRRSRVPVGAINGAMCHGRGGQARRGG